MSRRRHSRRIRSGGFLGNLRKNLKKTAGASVGVAGLFIAASPALLAASAATASGTQLSQGNLANVGPSIASAYGVNAQTGVVDMGKMISTVAFPVLGAIIFIKGLRMVVRAV